MKMGPRGIPSAAAACAILVALASVAVVWHTGPRANAAALLLKPISVAAYAAAHEHGTRHGARRASAKHAQLSSLAKQSPARLARGGKIFHGGSMLGFTGQGQHRSTRRGREKTYAAVAEECLPPRVLDSKGNCVSDPRGDPVPVYCQRRPSSSRCRAWKTKEKRKYRRYSKRLRKSYNYRYRRSQRNQGHMSRWTRNQIMPQRYPHRDLADLGDNIVSGFSDRDYKQRLFDDRFVDASEAHSHLPSMFGQGAPRESIHPTSRLSRSPYLPGVRNPYATDSHVHNPKGHNHRSYGVGEAAGQDDPSQWGRNPYNPRGNYAGFDRTGQIRRTPRVMKNLDQTPFARAVGSGVSDAYVSPRQLNKQWHPNPSWSPRGNRGLASKGMRSPRAFSRLPLKDRKALLNGSPYGTYGFKIDKPLLSDAIVPGDDESVDMFLAKHPEVPLASDHDDELDDYVGPMVSTVEDEKDALNHHPGGNPVADLMHSGWNGLNGVADP